VICNILFWAWGCEEALGSTEPAALSLGTRKFMQALGVWYIDKGLGVEVSVRES